MTATRSTALAGALQAGDVLDKPADDLPEMLEAITSTKAGVAALDALHVQLGDAERAVTDHAGSAETAQLRGEEAEQQHATQAGILRRRVARIRLAIDKATERLATVAERERRAEGEAAATRATKQADAIERLVAQYVSAARNVGALLEKIEIASAELVRDRAAALAAGVECLAKLPHEARFVPERAEERTVLDRHGGATITDADGRALDGKPVQYTETRRVERVIVQKRHAPRSILELRAALPDPDGGQLLDRGRD